MIQGAKSKRSSARVSLPALANNMGSNQVIARGMSTKFPLCVVVMELAAQLDARQLHLDAAWVPREFNQDADDLLALCRVSRAKEVHLGELRRPLPHAVVRPVHLALEAESKGVAGMQARVRQRAALVVPRPHASMLARVPLPRPRRGRRAPRKQSARAPEGLVTPGQV